MGHEDWSNSIAIGMLGQKPLIVSGGINDFLRVWELETENPFGEPFVGHEDLFTSVAVGMLGQKPLIVSGSWFNTISIWDLERRRSKTIQIGSRCNSVAIYAGNTIIVGTDSGIVVLEINEHTWDDAEEFEWKSD